MPGSRGSYSFTSSAVMPVLPAETNISLTKMISRVIYKAIPQFSAGNHNVSCACIHEPEIIKLEILPENWPGGSYHKPKKFPVTLITITCVSCKVSVLFRLRLGNVANGKKI